METLYGRSVHADAHNFIIHVCACSACIVWLIAFAQNDTAALHASVINAKLACACLQDTDLFADMTANTLDDAWQWLPLKARIMLLYFLSDLPRLAGHFHSPDMRSELSRALEQVTLESELTTAERGALRTASELIVCGEEVSKQAHHMGITFIGLIQLTTAYSD